MRYLSMLTVLLAGLMLTGCAAGIRGGFVAPNDEEAVPPEHGVLFSYDGERGTVEGVEWPDYYVSTVRFGDVSIHPITYPGWTVNKLDHLVIMQNQEMQAVIVIAWAQYPDVEVLREARRARSAGIEVSDVIIGRDARMTTHFSFVRADDREGAMWGLYTNYRNNRSGAILIGHWPEEHNDQLAPQLERMARNLVIRQAQRRTAPR